MSASLPWFAAAVLLSPQQPEVVPAPRPADDLEPVLQQIAARHGVPALGVATVVDGALASSCVVGVRRLGDPTRATAADLWHLGSCGKAMTAMAVARLVDRGALQFEATLGELFPEFAASMHEGFRRATLLQLLQHRAGLPGDTSAAGPFERDLDPAASPTEQRLRLCELALAEAPAYPPGSRADYSNTGYLIAGAVVERAAGAPFEHALRQLVFEPLGMTGAGLGPPGDAHGLEQPWGHATVLGHLVAFDPGNPLAAHPARYAPAGDVHVSLADWARFVAIHCEPAPARTPFVAARSLAVLHASPATDGRYACGFTVVDAAWAKGPVLAQHGSSPRWHALVHVSPADRFAVLAVCNAGGDVGTAACNDAVAARIAARPQ